MLFRLENRYQDEGWESLNEFYIDAVEAAHKAAEKAYSGIYYGMVRVVDTTTGAPVITFRAGITPDEVDGLMATAFPDRSQAGQAGPLDAKPSDDTLSKELSNTVAGHVQALIERFPQLRSVVVLFDWDDTFVCDAMAMWCNSKGPMWPRTRNAPTQPMLARVLDGMIGVAQLLAPEFVPEKTINNERDTRTSETKTEGQASPDGCNHCCSERESGSGAAEKSGQSCTEGVTEDFAGECYVVTVAAPAFRDTQH